jgi:putative Mg2+ transporter-C (MgtC) family protein
MTLFGIQLDPMVMSILISGMLGMLMGVERAHYHKIASIRTFGLVSAGSCIFMIISIVGASWTIGEHYDPMRVAANIVTGIGFLGGGVIFKANDKIEGITTAAMIWMTSAIGMLCGLEYYKLAFSSVGIYVVILVFGRLLHKVADKF